MSRVIGEYLKEVHRSPRTNEFCNILCKSEFHWHFKVIDIVFKHRKLLLYDNRVVC